MASKKLSINLLSQNSAGAKHILNVASNYEKTSASFNDFDIYCNFLQAEK
jgi:hypothetical protein